MEQRTLLGKHERTLAVYFWRWLSLIYPTARPRSQLVMRVLFKARLNLHRSLFNNGTIWMRSCIFSDFSYFHWSPVCASPSWFDWIKVTHPGKRLVWLKMPSPHISYVYTKKSRHFSNLKTTLYQWTLIICFSPPKHGGPVSTNKAASLSMFFGVVWHQALHLHHLCLQFFSFPPIF